MFMKHPCFKAPENENATVWRYVDFSKFISLLDTRSLHFTRLDSFDDRFEGAVPKAVVEKFRSTFDAMEKSRPKEWAMLRDAGHPPTVVFKMMRSKSVVNCWHLNEHESTAMWDQYLRSTSGVAIRSTYKRLVDSINNADDDLNIYIGRINYVDFDNDSIEIENPIAAATYKRISFQHEAELRAVAIGRGSSLPGFHWDMRDFPEHGIDVPISVQELVTAVHVAPRSPAWYTSTVKSVIAKYNFDVPVLPSSIDAQPNW